MIVKCCECKKIIGEKPPYKSTVISHTWCRECGAEVERQIREMDPISPAVERLATTSIDIVNFKP